MTMPIRFGHSAAITIAFVTACAPVAAQECKPAHKIESTVSPGKLTVAVYDYPPLVVTKPEFGGVDGEIVKTIAHDECLTIVPIVVDTAASIQYVLSGKADIAAGGWYRTAKRADVLGLSYPTYLDQMGIYSKDGESTISSLIGKQVGTVSGFLWVAELQKLLGTNLHLYPNPVALAQDLASGRIQVGVDSYDTGVYEQKRGGYPGIAIKVAQPDERVQASVQPAQVNLLYTKSNASLGAALDAEIKQMHKDGAIAEYLKAFGLNASDADPGEPRLIK